MTNETGARARRDPVRTRRVLLDAAAAAVAEHGAGVSVDVIARTAGVSKSGLLHHFRSKEELFVALAQDAYDRFTHDVLALTDPADLAPGRIMRGYLRATFSEIGDEPVISDYWSVMTHLSVVPAVAEAARADIRAWETRLTADGFDPTATRLLLLAAGGAELAETFGHVTADAKSALRDQLIQLTYSGAELAALLTKS